MAHRLVSWEGERPAQSGADAWAMREVLGLCLPSELEEASPAIRKFVEALTEIWPDDSADPRWERSPWQHPRILEGATGPTIYLDLTLEGGWWESNTIAEIADDYGLVTFDCALRMLLPAPEAVVTRRKLEMVQAKEKDVERLQALRRPPRPTTEGAWRPSTRRRRA